MLQNNLEFWIDMNLPPVMAEWLKKSLKEVIRIFSETDESLIEITK